MKLHASKVSTTSRPVMLFIAEQKIPCEMVDVDILSGEHLKEPFISLNPSKQVPVLDDDGFVLTESSTILKYLAEKTNSPTYPKELKQRARVNEAMDWLNTGFYREYGYHLIYPQLFPHHVRSPEEANKVTVEWGQAQSEAWLGVLQSQFLNKGTRYLCGNEITVADYFGSGIVSVGELIGVNFGKFPKVAAWLDNLRALPAWGSVYDVFAGFVASVKDKPFVTIR
jgi:glutathione S-transferase